MSAAKTPLPNTIRGWSEAMRGGDGPGDHSSHFIVQTAAAFMPNSCWGKYRRVAVLEVKTGVTKVAMISPRARGVVRIVRLWDKCNVGKGVRDAYSRALVEATELAQSLNERPIVAVAHEACRNLELEATE